MGYTIATNVLNMCLTSSLSSTLSPNQLALVLEAVENIYLLPMQQQSWVRAAFASSFTLQLQVVIGLCAAQFVGLALMVEKKLHRIE